MFAIGRPFAGSTVAELFSSILRDDPAILPLHLPDALREIVHKCLAKDARRRYQRAADVRLVLEAVAVGFRRRDAPSDPRVAAGAPLPPPPVLARSAGLVRLVGRDNELGQITQVWARAIEGQRQLLLIAGEPGIGKTRLASTFAQDMADQTATVLVGRCDEEALVPYQPFVEALSWYVRICPEPELRAQLTAIGGGAELGPLVPELLRRVPGLPTPPPMSSEGQRYRLFEAVSAFLSQAAAAHPVLLVFEDLHWADKGTLLMLRHIVRASDRAALCTVGTYRESELARTHPLAEMFADLRGEQAVTRLSLRGLDDPHVNGLIQAIAGQKVPAPLSRLVVDATDGNPFFVTEIVRHLVETGALTNVQHMDSGLTSLGLPEGVKDVIGRRVARLSDAANRTLSLAAVVGREFDIAVLEALGDVPEERLLDAIDEAVHAQLIVEAVEKIGHFSFVHALIRETVYGELSIARRVRLHRRVGETLERLTGHAPNPPLADLAYHFVQAASVGVVDKAVTYAVRAGDRAADAMPRCISARDRGARPARTACLRLRSAVQGIPGWRRRPARRRSA